VSSPQCHSEITESPQETGKRQVWISSRDQVGNNIAQHLTHFTKTLHEGTVIENKKRKRGTENKNDIIFCNSVLKYSEYSKLSPGNRGVCNLDDLIREV